MTKFTVRVDINSLSYDIEAVDEEGAIDEANKLAHMESYHDLFKWAYYNVAEQP